MLDEPERRQFVSDGYTVIRNVVPEALLAPVDREIAALQANDPPVPNHVGPHFWFLPPARLPAADAALRASPALELAESLVAPHRLVHGLDHIQIALNVPPYDHRPGAPHIDGHRANQVRPLSFTMLLAIFLGDESTDDTGNLWLWPGSHRTHEALFRQRGARALLPVDGHVSLLEHPPSLGPPIAVHAQRGDVLVAHYLLGHNSGGNLTHNTRRVLYFRLSCMGHAERWEQTFLHVLAEFAPLRALVSVVDA